MTAVVYLPGTDVVIAVTSNLDHVLPPIAEVIRAVLELPPPPLADLPMAASMMGAHD